MTNFLTTLRTLDAAATPTKLCHGVKSGEVWAGEKVEDMYGAGRLPPADAALWCFLRNHAAAIAGCVEALERLRDCDWVITPADRMDAVRTIARDALAALEEK